jgi:uncharacterized protein YndB with AHSA1/START domain
VANHDELPDRGAVITPRASIDIDADAESVIRFIADPANSRLWMVALEQSVQITPGPIAPGSRFREVQNAGGQRVETICEVVAFDPARQYAWKSVSQGDTQYGGSFTAEQDADGTRLRYEGWATATGRLARREAAWGRQAQRDAEAELARIKAAIEARRQ